MEPEGDQRSKPREGVKREKEVSFSLESIIYRNGELRILNQLMIPLKQEYESIETVEEGWAAIRFMKVRVSQCLRRLVFGFIFTSLLVITNSLTRHTLCI